MESTPPPPPPSSTNKSGSRPSKLRPGPAIPLALSLEIVPSSSPASTLSPRKRSPYTTTPLPLHDLLMLSPSPLKRSSKSEMTDDRRRCKTRSRRLSRRRVEQDPTVREEAKTGEEIVEILAKPTKKRHIERRSRKDKSVSQSLSSLRTTEGDYGRNMDAIGEIVNDLVMWKDVAKSSLWFGFGSLCFLSSCFARGITFSIFSFLSQVGLVFLGASFFSNTMRQREATEVNKTEFKLKEDDILRACRLVLPAANLVLSKTRQVFSGEPAMTLKVAPILLAGAEYGHLFTLWRLCALGFFICFTGPKLYSTYSSQLSKKVEYLKCHAMDAWKSCKHKKIVAASAVTAFWNLTSIRTRIFAAFLCIVIIRYRKQHSEDGAQEEEGQHDNALVVAVEMESNKKQHLL